VHDFTFEKPRYSLQADVRMWRDIHRLTAAECEGAEAVEKTPRADKASVPNWKRSYNRERAKGELTIRIGLYARVGSSERHTGFSGDGLGAVRHCARILRRASACKR
jgi:hypothetical protein